MAEILIEAPNAGFEAPVETPEAPAFPALAAHLPATPGRILVRRVIKATAEHFGTTSDDLVSACRTQPLSRRRQVAMYVARELTGRSFFFIGRKIGGRHHTTILHGVRAVRGLLDAGDGETVAAVAAIKDLLQVTAGEPRSPAPTSGWLDRLLRTGRA